jgi:hypothetical protein
MPSNEQLAPVSAAAGATAAARKADHWSAAEPPETAVHAPGAYASHMGATHAPHRDAFMPITLATGATVVVEPAAMAAS